MAAKNRVVFFGSFVSDEPLLNHELFINRMDQITLQLAGIFLLILYLGFYVWNNDCKSLDACCVCQQLECIVILNTERE